MALLMMVSSTGISMDMHFCQDVLKSVRLIGEAPNCHEQAAKIPACHRKMAKAQAPSCHQPIKDKDADCEKDCCSHKVIHAQLDTEILKSDSRIEIDLPAFSDLVLFAYALIYDQTADQAQHHYLDYKPPQLEEDFSVLFQAFLI